MDLRKTEGVDWVHLSQNTDQWQAVVNTVMNFGFHKRRGICRLIQLTIAFSRNPLVPVVSYRFVRQMGVVEMRPSCKTKYLTWQNTVERQNNDICIPGCLLNIARQLWYVLNVCCRRGQVKVRCRVDNQNVELEARWWRREETVSSSWTTIS
jgi:hypothetical protein